MSSHLISSPHNYSHLQMIFCIFHFSTLSTMSTMFSNSITILYVLYVFHDAEIKTNCLYNLMYTITTHTFGLDRLLIVLRNNILMEEDGIGNQFSSRKFFEKIFVKTLYSVGWLGSNLSSSYTVVDRIATSRPLISQLQILWEYSSHYDFRIFLIKKFENRKQQCGKQNQDKITIRSNNYWQANTLKSRFTNNMIRDFLREKF